MTDQVERVESAPKYLEKLNCVGGAGQTTIETWYETAIEPEIRDVVRLLRDNGFNTECSCGHEMYVQCQFIVDGSVGDLDRLLFNAGHRDYVIHVEIRRLAGHIYNTMQVDFRNVSPPES